MARFFVRHSVLTALAKQRIIETRITLYRKGFGWLMKRSYKSTRVRQNRSTRTLSRVATRTSGRLSRRAGWLGVGLLLTLGLGLILYQPVMDRVIGPRQLERAYAEQVDHHVIRDNNARDELTAYAPEPEREGDLEDDLDPPYDDDIFDYEGVTPIMTLSANPVVDQRRIIGQIAIPDVDLALPILRGVSQEILSIGAGTLKRDQTMGFGNYALISHNSRNTDVLFAPLHRVDSGYLAYLTDREVVYVYELNVIQEIRPEHTSVVDDRAHSMLTLITCTPDGENRLLVQGDLVDQFVFDTSDTEIQDLFSY